MFQERIPPPLPYTLNGENLFHISGQFDETSSYYIDDTAQYQGEFTCGPYRPLEKGIYNVTVFYETDTDDNTAYAFSETAKYIYGSLKTDAAVLKAGFTSKSFKIWLKNDLTDFEIRTSFGGEGYLKLHRIEILKSKTTYTLVLFYVILLVLSADFLLFLYYMRKHPSFTRDKYLLPAGIFLIILFASYPLFYDFLIYGTDIRFHLMRIDGIKDALKSAQFPVKIAPTFLNGYGHAVSTFYGNLFLYVPALLRLIGFTMQGAYKIYCVFIIILTCLLSYYALKNIFKSRQIGLVGSMLYTLSAYQITMIYSGWVGVFTAAAFLPLIFYGMYKIFTDDSSSPQYKSVFLPLMFGLSGIIQSHILTCEITAIFIILTCIILIKKVIQKPIFLALAKTVIFTLLLNAWFLIPFLDYMGGSFNITSDRTLERFNIQSNGIPLANLFSMFQNNVNARRTFPYGIGPAMLLGIGIYIYSMFRQKDRDKKYYRLGIFSISIGTLCTYMCTNLFPWDRLSQALGSFSVLVSNIEYPWRFLAAANTFFVVAVCYGLSLWGSVKDKRVQTSFIIALTAVTALFINDEYSTTLKESNNFYAYDTEAFDQYDYDMGWGIQQYLPTDTDIELLNHDYPIPSEGVSIAAYQKSGVSIDLTCSNVTAQKGYIELPLIHYDGYRAVNPNRKEVFAVHNSDHNTLLVEIPPNYSGDINVNFAGTLSLHIRFAVPCYLWNLRPVRSLHYFLRTL